MTVNNLCYREDVTDSIRVSVNNLSFLITFLFGNDVWLYSLLFEFGSVRGGETPCVEWNTDGQKPRRPLRERDHYHHHYPA